MSDYHERSKVKRWVLYAKSGEFLTETRDPAHYEFLLKLYAEEKPFTIVLDDNQKTPERF